jgi:homoserine dehydrogenase
MLEATQEVSMIKIAVLGCGTVGSGVVKLLQQNSEIIAMRAGEPIQLKWVMDIDKDKCRALGIDESLITDQFADIVNDKEVDIVVELIGGIEPAFRFITDAMSQGKHIVTANKDLIAVKGKEIFADAEANHVDFYFEASVAGGIPIIAPLKQSLAGTVSSKSLAY